MGHAIASSNASRTFLSISKGFLHEKTNEHLLDENGNPVLNENGTPKMKVINHNGWAGVITAINTHQAPSSKGGEVEYLDIVFDGTDQLSLDITGNTAESLAYLLASAKSFAGKNAELRVWLSSVNGKDYTNVSVSLDGEKLSWTLAPKDRAKITPVCNAAGAELKDGQGRTIYDRSARFAEVREMIAKAQLVLKNDIDTVTVEEPGAPDFLADNLDDMPEEI